jgi:O-antigen/teichoic acid export membrane protein
MLSQAKYLTAAGMLEYALQLVLPMYLVRALTSEDFASYRFLGLLLGTASAALLFGMPSSLSYFLPRLDARERGAYVTQTLVFSLLMGCFAAGLVATGVALVASTGPLALLPPSHLAVYALLAIYFASLPLDGLPLAQGQIRTQAVVNALGSVVRVGAVAAGAWIGTIEAVCWAMVVFAMTRCAILAIYLARELPLGRTAPRLSRFRDQIGYALPFGLSGAFYMMRGQAEQWIAAGLLSPAEFAAVSIAAVVSPFVLMIRGSISRSIVPTLNRLAHAGRHDEMIALNARGNLAATAILVPLLCFVFVFADVLVTTVYTERYAAAADVMRVICVGLLAYCVEFASMNACFRIGRKVAIFDGSLLVITITISVALTQWIGLQGAVAGSAVGLYLGASFSAWLAKRQLHRPISGLQPWGPVARYLLAGLASAALSGGLLQSLRHDQAEGFAVAVSAGGFALAYLVLIRLLGLSLMPARGLKAPRPIGDEVPA